MGQYSLENYEQYKTYKIRPDHLAVAPKNKGCGVYKTVVVDWIDIEPTKGNFILDPLLKALVGNVILVIAKKVPKWVMSYDENLPPFLDKLASVLDGHSNIIGLAIKSHHQSSLLVEAYLNAFVKTPLMIYLEDTWLISGRHKYPRNFGIIISLTVDNTLDCCVRLAKHGLQHTWQHSPVVVNVEEGQLNEDMISDIHRWHPIAATCELKLGFNLRLRRLTYPVKLSSGGAMPLRFWFENTGTSPIYHKVQVKLKLCQGSNDYNYSLDENEGLWTLGDITMNQIIRMEAMPVGDYEVWIRLDVQNEALAIDCAAPRTEAYYHVGMAHVDEVRREAYFNIWDSYYPEGYYPLEDPKVPESN